MEKRGWIERLIIGGEGLFDRLGRGMTEWIGRQERQG